jgi:hypothetical protein
MSIYLPMMEPEGWFSRRDVHISSWITPNTVMPTSVQRESLGGVRLEADLEGVHVSCGVDVVGNVDRSKVLRCEVVVKETSRIVTKAITARVYRYLESRIHGGRERPQIYGKGKVVSIIVRES